MSRVKRETPGESRGYQPWITKFDHCLLPDQLRSDLKGLILLAIIGLNRDRFSWIEGSFSDLRLPAFPLSSLTDNKGNLIPVRQPVKRETSGRITDLPEAVTDSIFQDGSDSTGKKNKIRKEHQKEFSEDDALFAPAKLSFLLALLFGKRDLAAQIALDTFLPYYYLTDQVPEKSKDERTLQKVLRKAAEVPSEILHRIIMENYFLGQSGKIDTKTKDGLRQFHIKASGSNYAPTGPGEKNALKPKARPKSIKTLMNLIDGLNTLDPDLFFNLLSGNQNSKYNPKIDKEIRDRRLAATSELGVRGVLSSLDALVAYYGASNLFNLLREGKFGEELGITLGYVGFVALGVLGLLINKDLKYLHNISKQATTAIPEARDRGLEKIKDMGGLIRNLHSAVLDLFDRREYRKYANNSLFPLHGQKSRDDFLIKLGLTGLSLSNKELMQLLDLNPARDIKKTDIDEYLNKLLITGDNDSPFCLSEVMVRTAAIEYFRECGLRHEDLKLGLPPPHLFGDSTLELGQTRLATVKKKSAEEADPLVALSLALPVAFRFLGPEFAANIKALGSDSGWSDAITYGSKIKNPQAGNLGNSGILPFALKKFWISLRRTFPHSYIDSTIDSFGEAIKSGEVAKVRNLLSEVISSPLMIQALSSILYFAYDSGESGPSGSEKHFVKAFNAAIMEDLQKPDKFLLALSVISGLNFNTRAAAGLQKYYSNQSKIFEMAIDNIRDGQLKIIKSIFNYFLNDKTGFVSKTENEAEKSLLAKQFTMFISWIAKENPELLCEFAGDIESLCSRSGEMGENHPPSITTFFALYFVADILKPEDGKAFNKYGVPRTTEDFFTAVVGHLYNHAGVLIDTNLRLDSPVVDISSYENLTHAQKFLENCFSVFGVEQLEKLASKLNQTILTETKKVGSKFSSFSEGTLTEDQMRYFRFKWDKLIEIADSLLNKGILPEELRKTVDCLRQEIDQHSEPRIIGRAFSGRLYPKT